jgi:hypothetical protein
MLQQGKYASDVAYFYGQEAPITGIWGAGKQTDAPQGYSFDFVNGDVILNKFSVKNGDLTTDSGMDYRILYMGPRTVQVTLPVLKKLQSFVSDGAVIIGSKPTNSPSLGDDDAEFQRIVSAMWGDGAAGEHVYGKGKIFVGQTSNQVLQAIGLPMDFDYTKPQPDTVLWNHHRRLADGDIYFVVNRSNRAQSVEAGFRVSGKAVELWNPMTGKIQPAAYRTENGRTIVPLKFDALGSIFVVMRKPGLPSKVVPEKAESQVSQLDGAWRVTFQEKRGAPASAMFPSLTSWSENSDAGIKYFSGTGTYSKTIDAPSQWFKTGAQLWLDLGEVNDLAEVIVNGKNLGVFWYPPYRVEVTDALKPGQNEVKIGVTNTWVNRLIGDQQPGALQYTFGPSTTYQPDSPLLPAGLLGPVRIFQAH